jgi:hypothetical protein
MVVGNFEVAMRGGNIDWRIILKIIWKKKN